MGEINVVPYIDVMLVLLVIFMITAPLLSEGVKVNLPKAQANPLDFKHHRNEPLILTVNAKGRYFLNVGEHQDKALPARIVVARAAAVLKNSPNTQVVVKGDSGVDYNAVLQGMVLLQRAGASSVGLETNPEGAPEIKRTQ
jgi:biopolymer transport protein TolR